ncbi:hypothetical protein CcaverHIS002_0311220 [Cutaneotrichosporon cavernicola]|uniref:Sas10 C-terminal domain-containing protein n=1 Tax=Cutaneotrichosporon cavernicola TaxID=279322 RepID=A0AA48QV67_9TREE|nr:uncharacterized protein CcaverHIS019_0311080 [Cutaneotrichosporon cavernicola]BEI83254.1 hypothetical protein CcaverHIS002_0311220 [Cutaneotrichosporon cavernicola]BEI91038.1 hypothetical protein CcaverHIS019_0311080 [Cutaneotrichosporon cavernicola]BEI98817.1 hypothetical protein CcaverHIS631_0311160 [Cutaneotrichosporon cavernicola]
MGRKRRSNGAAAPTKAKEAPGASIKRIESYEDTLQEGGVDDYMFKRDQIMIDPHEEESDGDIGADGDEVLGLNVHKFGRDEDAEEEYEEGEEEWAEPKQLKRLSKAKPDLSTKGRFGKEEEDSDDYSEDDSEEDSGSESEEEGWGRQYYSRPSTRREKEDEGAYDDKREEDRELEEKEVRKLQKRAREALSGAEDWGLDDVEVEYAAPETEEAEEARVVVAAPETDDAPTLLRHLASHEPLKLALARDFPLILRKLRKTSAGIAKMEAEAQGEETLHKGLGYLHYQTLLTYATTLAFYIHLCALPADERPDLSSHPVISRLLELKQGLAALEDLDFDAGSVSDKGPELFVRPDEDEDEDMAEAKRELMARMLAGELPGAEGMTLDEFDRMDEEEEEDSNLWHQAGLEDDELDGLLADQDAPLKAKSKKEKKEKKEKEKKGKKKERGRKKKSKAAEDEEEDEEPAPVAFTPLAEPEFIATKKKSKKAPKLSAEDETLGDLLELTDADAGDKEHRKRSLQFHTQKINSMANRRSAARDRRAGGDDDIPYRSRQAARDAALRKNAPKGDGGEDLGGDWTESDRKRAREVRDEEGEGADEAEEYYDLVKRRKVAKDAAKEEAHEDFREAKFAAFEDESSEGPRGVSRAIEKNRGLTPRRSKTGRNPRVKKKLAYEKAKQKVGSQRAVYKGGQAAQSGAYAGEKSGITTVSKSRKF